MIGGGASQGSDDMAQGPRGLRLPPPPSAEDRELLLRLLRPAELLLRPRFYGTEVLPSARPLLFVGNHQVLSMDTPFLMAELFRRGIALRVLADDFLFAVRPLAHALRRFGVVYTNPAVADALVDDGQSVLVYPGGAREAAKVRGRPYSLEWWDRLGFARLALRHRLTVVTVAARGFDDSVRLLLSRDEYLRGPLAALVERLPVRRDLFPPLVLPRRLPRPCFKFGGPIEMDHFFGHDEDSAIRRLRGEIAGTLERDLEWLANRPGPS